MSSVAPLLRIPVGAIVERRQVNSPWADAFARATAAVVRARNTSMTCGRQGILKTAREWGSVACSLVGVRFAEDSTLEGASFEPSVPL